MEFKHPFTCLLSGPTGCGKTFFIKRLILSDIIKPPPFKIIFCYAQEQPLYSELALVPNLQLMKGIPDDLETSGQFQYPHLFIFDDLIDTCVKDPRISKIFTQGSHHRNLSVILITQNLFFKDMRTISLNAHYLVLFKNARDQKQILFFASQICPGDVNFIKEAYQDATSKPYGYLLLNFYPGTSDAHQVLSCILPGERTVVYTSKKRCNKKISNF